MSSHRELDVEEAARREIFLRLTCPAVGMRGIVSQVKGRSERRCGTCYLLRLQWIPIVMFSVS